MLSPGKIHGSKSPAAPSPKKGQKKEDGWKEVIRKSKKVSVPSNAISRVIGRSGCNINAIREVSGAHIEVDKAKGQGDRNITIKGSADATRQAHSLIMALIKDPDKEIEQIIPKQQLLKPKPAATNTLSASNVWSNSIANGTTSSTTASPAAPPPTAVSAAQSAAKSSPACSSKQGAQRQASISKASASNAANNNVMTNIGTFQVGAWGSVNLGTQAPTIPGLVRPPTSSKATTPGKTQAKVARQLFAESSIPFTTSGVKSTITYTSPSMAKTKVVMAASPSVSSKVESKAQSPHGTSGNGLSSTSTKPVVQSCIPSVGARPPVSSAAPRVDPQPLPIKASTGKPPLVGPGAVPTPSQAPGAHYSPFEDTLFSQMAERVLSGKKDETGDSNRLNFATVAAAGVVSTQASMLPGASPAPPASSMADMDPHLQAKAPGYKAPGQRTNSPQVSEMEGKSGFKPGMGYGPAIGPPQMSSMAASAGYRGMPPVMVPPSVDTFDKVPGYRTEAGMMLSDGRPDFKPSQSPSQQPQQQASVSPRSAASTPVGQSPRQQAALMEEYTTPHQPMTLPRIESNLNPNAPDFTSRPPLLRDMPPPMRQQQQMSFMMHSALRHNFSNQTIAELAQLMSGGTLPDLSQQSSLASLAAFAGSAGGLMGSPAGDSGLAPPSQPSHQFSPAPGSGIKSSSGPPSSKGALPLQHDYHFM